MYLTYISSIGLLVSSPCAFNDWFMPLTQVKN